MMKTIQLN